MAMCLSRSVARAQSQNKNAEAEDCEEAELFTPVEQLEQLGINRADVLKCKGSGLHTVEDVVSATAKEMDAIKGFSEAKIQKVLTAAYKIKNPFQVMTGSQFLETRKEMIKITTGVKSLDLLLGGGVETLSLTEVFGEFRAGKTQFCHTLCVTCQMPVESGGGGGKVIYIDTEGTFRPERVAEIARARGLDHTEVLDNVLYARLTNSTQQIKMIPKIAAIITSDEMPYRLVIIDSIMGLFRVDYSGRGELADRQQKLNRHLSSLSKLAGNLKVAVVIVNQVTADPGANAMFVRDAKKPVGGHILAHASQTRLYFRKGKGEQRICKLYDSPSQPESDAMFAIGASGIHDCE